MAALPLQNLISNYTNVKVNYHILRAQFGDGYEQTAPNGLRNKETIWEVLYENLNESDAATVLSFLDGLNGSVSFQATLPAETVAKNWKINPDSLSVRYTARDNHTLLNYRSISFSARSRD